MIKQRNVKVKTATATIAIAEMGDILCNSTNAQTYTLPAVSSGLWYRFSNINTGVVTISNGSTLATLAQNQQCLILNNGAAWNAFTGGGDIPFTKLLGVPSSYAGSANKIVAVNSAENALEFIDAPTGGGGGLVIDPNHIFIDNTARDSYFTANSTELVAGIYVSVGTGFQQWDGSTWLDKTAVITGPAGAAGGLVKTTYGLQFGTVATEDGADQNATSGSLYTSISSNTVGIIKPLRITEVKVDLKAGSYNLWIDRVDQGRITLASDTADASFLLATPAVLSAGLHRFEIIRTASGVWYYKSTAHVGTIWYETDMMFGTGAPGAYSIPMRLVACLGEWGVVS